LDYAILQSIAQRIQPPLIQQLPLMRGNNAGVKPVN
jgi:hypothetical protein